MRGNNQIIVLDHQVVDRSGRQVQLEWLPVRAIIPGNVDSRFGSGIEQTLLPRIFADRVHVSAVGNAVGDFRPALSQICGSVDVRPQIIEFVTVQRHVSGAGVMW